MLNSLSVGEEGGGFHMINMLSFIFCLSLVLCNGMFCQPEVQSVGLYVFIMICVCLFCCTGDSDADQVVRLQPEQCY